MAKRPVKPEPKPTAVVCTVCGLPWERHGEDPTLATCVKLLRAELAKQPTYSSVTGSGLLFPTHTGVNLS